LKVGAELDRPVEPRFSFTAFQLAAGGLILLAAILRLWNIGSVPIELHPDEMAPYVGIRDMLSGQRPFGVFIESDVVYLPLYGIFEFLSTLIFGNTVTAMRVPAALLGVASALGTGLLAYSLVRDRAVFLIALGIMAILPWDIALSRVGMEPAAVLPFLLFGVYLLRRGLLETSGRFVVAGCCLLALGAYAYRAEALYAVGLAFACVAIEYRQIARNRGALVLGLAAAAVILAPLVIAVETHPYDLSNGPAQMTFSGGVNQFSIHIFLTRYLAQFSPLALFDVGDGNLAHGPDVGVLYWWMLPFIVIGALAPKQLLGLRARLFLLAWTAAYPIGNGFVNEFAQTHFMRTLVGAPLFAIWAAIGCRAAWLWLQQVATQQWRAVVLALFAFLTFVQFVQFCGAYFIRYPALSANEFQYGNRDIFAFVRAHAASAKLVCFAVLTDWNWSTLTRYYMSDMTVKLHDGIEPPCARPSTLYVVPEIYEAPQQARLLGTVQRRDGTIRAYFLR